MNPIVRNVLAVILGIAVGSMVNLGLVSLGPVVIPLPEGVDNSSMESLREGMKLFTPIHFVFPFLGHALGTLSGAFVAAKLAVSHHMRFALVIGAVFLIGGIATVNMIGGPMWFNAADILLAYIPMGYIGGKLAERIASPE